MDENRTPPRLEPLPPGNMDQPKKELEVKHDDDLIARYRLFQYTTGVNPATVYHPCSAEDDSPSIAFPKSRIIYVETDTAAVTALKKAGHEAHLASAEEFNPGKVDVLILLNPVISPDYPVQFVAQGGYVLCNDYHDTASDLRKKPNWKFKGIILRNKDGQLKFDTENLGQCWEVIKSEEEWKKAPFTWRALDYETAANYVEIVTGKRKNVLAEYTKLLEQAKQEHQTSMEKMKEKYPEMANLLSKQADEYLIRRNNHTLVLDTHLPKKKGTVDDIFVFQKVNRPQPEQK